jgi:hypothetical protein
MELHSTITCGITHSEVIIIHYAEWPKATVYIGDVSQQIII